jgi:hypothetical protein
MPRSIFAFLLTVIFVFGAAPASAFEEINTGYLNDLALKGYDSAGYFSRGVASEGSDTFSFSWKGADWQFADAKSRDLFAANPEKYAPQFGGYCSNQMSLGNLSNIDPGVWLIHKDKLYFFGHQVGKDRWVSTGVDARIADAEKHWADYLADKK